MDVLTQLPHCALRTYVMGERGAEDTQPTDAELVEMTRIVRQGIEAGAFGVSSNRLLAHRTKAGELIPGTLARYPEIEAIAKGAARMAGISVTYLMGEGDYTICGGEIVLEQDELTGALPGRLVRRPPRTS